ncbi:hypothetical protein ECF2_0197 [Enterobacter phage EC-F2]|uniref:Uncharacterized protein n=2 Tax=Pseudotevenvirus leb TaxID=2844035 RepID=A0A7T3TLM5_9CAUD|nr:hypothetical protein HWB00_gp136 [Cronobacter phage vB_CsaM_leB]AOG16262.1 hypothetical protein B_136 [Cronobacter phage vB_CsaM_leB]QPX76484.1 hypothetical protein [Cronobacter phage vB_CsaM_SemperBestia]URP86423.1 hypothetical protein ECF2_0197 [Enterobacter phage EC-F2]
MIKRPYCLVNRPICAGGLPVNCWQLIETGEAFLNKRGDKVFVYGVDSIENETMVITDEKTKEKYTLTSDHDCRNFNVYWKYNEDFEGIKS